MDRKIPETEKKKAKAKRFAIIGVITIAIAAAYIAVSNMMRTTISREELLIASVDTGTIESTISSSGRIAPAFEEIIISPISSRIIEVYCKAGDSLAAGTPILKLDLQSTETELNKLHDQHGMKSLDIEQARLDMTTQINSIEMQIKVKSMEVNRLKVEVDNEKHLDSIGSGTGDRIKQADLNYKKACLELEQLKTQLKNEKATQAAKIKAKNLELNISQKNIALQTRLLDDARICAPRAATLTMLNAPIGQPVNQGQHVATIADLNHFKATGTISDTYLDMVRPGGGAIVRVGKRKYRGTITNVNPQSNDGMISYEVRLEDDAAEGLRPGLKADIFIVSDIIEEAIRIPYITSYTNAGNYMLYVVDENNEELRLKDVTLGSRNADYIEVKAGLEPGEKIVTNNMAKYENKPTIRIK